MKRQKLQADYEIDFEVFGIVSTYKDFKLASNLNDKLHLALTKKKDLRLRFVDHELVVSNFLYETPTSQIWLIKNRSHEFDGGEGAYFVPELTEMDYFLRTAGTKEKNWMNELRSIPGVDYTHFVNLDKLKSKENFIF